MIPKNSQFNDFDRFRTDDNFYRRPSGGRQIAKGNSQGERGGVHQFVVPENFAWVQHFNEKNIFIDARKLGVLVFKTQPYHRTSEINCAFQVQKLRISEQTKGFSRLRSAETAWNPEFV